MAGCLRADNRIRRRWRFAAALSAGLLGLSTHCASQAADAPLTAASVEETTTLAIVFQTAKEARLAAPQGRVLLVLDIDNTLLTAPQYLGGDNWFNRHAVRIREQQDPDFSSMGELIAAQTIFFGMASLDATEPHIPEQLADTSRAGVDIFLLSARGPELYDATRRELDRNMLLFRAPYACAFFMCTEDGVYRNDEIRAGLAAVGERPSTSPYRNILIRNGMMLVAGQDKGVMLKLLMGVIGGQHYTRVIIADDGRENIEALATSRSPVPLTLFHYRRVATSVTEAEEQQARSQLAELTTVVCSALQSALCGQPGRRRVGK